MCAAIVAELPDAQPGVEPPRRVSRRRQTPLATDAAGAGTQATAAQAGFRSEGSIQASREAVIQIILQSARANMGEDSVFQVGETWLDKTTGSSVWYRFWSDPVTKQNRKKTTGLYDEAAAQRWLVEYVLDQGPVSLGEDPNMTVAAAVRIYLMDPERNASHKGCSSSTITALESAVPGVTIRGFTQLAQEKLIDALHAGPLKKALGVGSIANCMILLTAAVRAACRPNRAGEVLCPRAPLPIIVEPEEIAGHLGIDPPEPRNWHPGKSLMARFLAKVAQDEAVRRYFVLALAFACRVSAAVEATPDQYEPGMGVYRLNPKGRRQQKSKYRPTLPVPPSVLAEISCWGDGEWVGISADELRGRVWDFAEETQPGLGGKLIPACTRHFMATFLRDAYADYGLPPVPDQQHEMWLGHRHKGVNHLYGKFSPKYLLLVRNAVECILHDLDEQSGYALFRNARAAGTLPPEPVVVDPETIGQEARRARAARQASNSQPSSAKSGGLAALCEGSKAGVRAIHDVMAESGFYRDFEVQRDLTSGKTVEIGGKRGKFSQVQPRRPRTLDEAFEPSPLDAIHQHRNGGSIFCFEPEDGAGARIVIVSRPKPADLQA